MLFCIFMILETTLATSTSFLMIVQIIFPKSLNKFEVVLI
ncbi:hypothetical protein BN193_10210 [Lactococcus raffinolactis 4877]|nr:hypothetical protein BN193_10210 [Lactococcus raffinolactis 4877]